MAPPRTVKSFEAIPAELKALKQWCNWKLEQDNKGKPTKKPYNPAGYLASSTDPNTWSTFEEVKAAYEDESRNFAGVGFFFNNDFTGVDFDHCIPEGLNPADGLMVSGKLTLECLCKLNTYTEISQSGTGLHSIIKPPMPENCRHKSGNYEMYSRGRFFVMTGNVPPRAPTAVRVDKEALDFVYSAIFGKKQGPETPESKATPEPDAGSEETDSEIVARICRSQQAEKFMKLFQGDTSDYPSASEADGALAAILGFYTNKNFAKTLKIISQSKLWDEKWAREDYQRRTIEGAFDKLTETYGKQRNALNRVEWALGYFVDSAGYTRQGGVDEKGNKTSELVSEGYAYLDAILEDFEQNPPERYFVIRGKSISAKDEFELTSKIADFGEDRAAKKILLNQWAEDKLGGMNINVIKSLSPKPVKHIRILRRPAWVGNELVAPGLSTTETRFGYEKKVHVDFSSAGDVSAGREALNKALLAFDPKNTALLFATVLGAPIIARLWSGDRYCLFIQATTQMKKTTAAMLFMSMYGTKYSDESSLVRWGDGATGNATEHLAARTGPFPFLLDNYKQYTDKDPSALQRLIHAVVEGTEKDRLNRESMLRSGMEYLCSLIITGEQFPGQDAATRARIVELLWTNATNLEYLSEAQAHIEDINAFGKAWLQWLNSPHGLAVMNEYAPRFEAARLHYIKAAKDAANVGRLASNAAVVTLVWEIFNQWPEGHDLAKKFYPHLKAAIDEHIFNTEADISEQLDGRKFIDWLKAEFMVGRYYVTGRVEPVRIGTISEHIGIFNLANSRDHREMDEVLIAPEILSAKLLPAWQKATNGTRTDKKALLRQLVSLGYLLYDEKHKGYSVVRRVDERNKRVHVFVKIFSSDEGQPVGEASATKPFVAENRDAEKPVTGSTSATCLEDKMCFEDKISDKSITDLHESSENKDGENNNNINTGNTGYTGSTESTSIDFAATRPSPVTPVKREERKQDCGSHPVAPKGDPSAKQDEEARAAEEAQGCNQAAKHSKLDPTTLETVRIIKPEGYRTQIPHPENPNRFVDHLYSAGEIVEIQHWKAKDLIERHIAEPVGRAEA